MNELRRYGRDDNTDRLMTDRCDPRTAIAVAFWGEPISGDAMKIADRVLRALADAGYSVVKLPTDESVRLIVAAELRRLTTESNPWCGAGTWLCKRADERDPEGATQ